MSVEGMRYDLIHAAQTQPIQIGMGKTITVVGDPLVPERSASREKVALGKDTPYSEDVIRAVLRQQERRK